MRGRADLILSVYLAGFNSYQSTAALVAEDSANPESKATRQAMALGSGNECRTACVCSRSCHHWLCTTPRVGVCARPSGSQEFVCLAGFPSNWRCLVPPTSGERKPLGVPTLVREKAMNQNFGFRIGRAATLTIAIENIVFDFSLVWRSIFHAEFDQDLRHMAGRLSNTL